jgi:UDP-glucose 4-epimerase
MIILVTGCAGYIGSFLCEKLIELGHDVYGIDNLCNSNKSSIPKKVKFILGDLRLDSTYKKVPANTHIDKIFHLAAQSGGDKSFDNVFFDESTNIVATLKLLNFAVKNSISHIVFTSSMAVYGDSDLIVSEESPKNPKSFYGNSKLAAENYIRIFSENFGIKYTNLRLFNVYGPKQTSKNFTQGIISIYIEQALINNKIEVKGSKERVRDLVYIDDVINVFLLCLTKTECINNTFNVGYGDSVSIEELLNEIISRLISKVPIIYKTNTRGDIDKIFANIEKLKKIGYKPRWNITKGLDKVFASL